MSLLIVIPGLMVALFTITASLAAVFRVGRLKSALEASERAAKAWEDERDAAVAKATRLESDMTQLQKRVDELERLNRQLQERTDLTHYLARQDEQHQATLAELHKVGDRVGNLATAIEVLAVNLKPLAAAS